MNMKKKILSGLKRVVCSDYFRVPVWALFLTLLIEALNFSGNSGGLDIFTTLVFRHPWAFLTGFLLVCATMMPMLFFKRRFFAVSLTSFVWLVCGCINGYIRNKRQTPFTASDIAEVRAGLDTLPNYMSVWTMILIGAAVLLAIAGLVLLFLRGKKCVLPVKRRLLGALAAVAATGVCLLGCWEMGFHTGQLSEHFSNLTYAYNDYGFAYCFLQTMLNRGIRMPVNYSKHTMEKVAEEIPAADEELGAKCNIIFIQLESLLDPEKVRGLTLSEDAMPNLHRLAENYSSGSLIVPVVGAGTANTEFEMLTGMSCRFFGPGEYPYKSRAQKMPIESMASALKEQGYTTYAVHNHRATFYNRTMVYENLGFDYFTSVEYMPEMPRTPNGWATDGVLTSQILSALDNTDTASDFVFTVTVQCHGSYPTDPVLEDPKICVEDCPEALNRNAMEYYCNQLYETDRFVGDLLEALEERGEPTVVVLYGDHLPMLKLTSNMMTDNSLYRTNYVIWDNIGLEKRSEVLSAYQLGAETLSRIGYQGGLLSRYHQNSRQSRDYLSDLRLIEYDILYGQQFILRGQTAPEANEMQMGVESASITEVVEDDDCFFVLGEGFTPYCRVAVKTGDGDDDYDLLKTKYMTDGALRVEGDAEDYTLDELSIVVVDSHKKVLGEVYD